MPLPFSANETLRAVASGAGVAAGTAMPRQATAAASGARRRRAMCGTGRCIFLPPFVEKTRPPVPSGGGRAGPCLRSLGGPQRALHAGWGMTGHGADVRLGALGERDPQRRSRAGLDHRGLLAGDLEVVRELALVRDLEH